MAKELRCLITNTIIKDKQWFWYSWEMDAPISEKGMAEIQTRRFDPDDEFAHLIWEEWSWSAQVGHIDL
jgi:hypothetical protein